mmetsp:Transcript_24574/g.21810  ORF Transcript_24574/g.21810 Transcript_24574/m.21810 type:complete len:86 (+) Transcript_24574:3-260(+)
MLAIGDEDDHHWKWISVPTSILAVLTLIIHEILELRAYVARMNPQKANSFEVSPLKSWSKPNPKESTIEIKVYDKKLDTEKENLK